MNSIKISNSIKWECASILLFFFSIFILAGCGNRLNFKGREQQLREHLIANEAQLIVRHSTDETPVQFTVEPGTAARAIGQKLEEQGFIADQDLFEAYVRFHGLANQLDAGTFSLSPAMHMLEIVDALQNAQAASINLTIPEGWRYEQIVDYLAAENIFGDRTEEASTEENSIKMASITSNGAKLYGTWVAGGGLAQRPLGSSLEGYLFPDTYSLEAEGTGPDDVLQRQLDNFAAQVIPLYNTAQQTGYSVDLHGVLTVASIVEREAVLAEERAAIAGVYLNRLALGMKLEADPTVQYGMGYQVESRQWWKTPVYLEEYSSVDSPYNSYLYSGMPPGPICNPGLESIRAVLEPAQHEFLFFVGDPDQSGAHIFAKTYEEHVENVRRYQRGQ